MRVLGESWCFCNGGGKSERLKASLFSTKSSAMARFSTTSSSSNSSGGGTSGCGAVDGAATGFLIHRNLLLTTHGNLPSVAAAESAEIRLQNAVPATLVPHRFFITSSVLDLTIVGLDSADGDLNAQGHQPHYLRTCSKPNLDLGSVVYILGYTGKKELMIGEGKVVIATDNLIKLSTDGVTWSCGSAGFDGQGNLAFMICDPMKLSTSPNTRSSTSSSSTSSWKRDLPMQFGIPVPAICDWLNQHWEGNLDELNKPKLPLMRLVSAGHKSEHSCASFTMRQVFKFTDTQNDGTPSSSNGTLKSKEQHRPSCSADLRATEEEKVATDPRASAHVQGIPTPEIYESPRVTAVPVRKKELTPMQLLDINFPPRRSKAAVNSQPLKGELLPGSGENCIKEINLQSPLKNEQPPEEDQGVATPVVDSEAESTGSVNNGALSEVQSSSSPVAVSESRDGQHSEVETMYSAETAESRNITTPREVNYQPVGRSQSCVNYNRWAVHKYPVASKTPLDKQRSFTQPRKTHSHGATSHRSNDYYSPTVSSIMKKRNNMEQPTRSRQTVVHTSPRSRWMF